MGEHDDILLTAAEIQEWVKIAIVLIEDFPPIFVETVIAQETDNS
jgi:hypothetical protein